MMIKQKSFGSNCTQIGVQNNIMISDNCVVKMNHDDSLIIVNGIKLPPPPTKCWNVTNINGKVYIDGYEFKNGKWKKTLRAWWHLWF